MLCCSSAPANELKSQESISAVLLLGLPVRRLHSLEPQKPLKFAQQLFSQSATTRPHNRRHGAGAYVDTYGGRDAGEDEEAQDRRVQGAVGADYPEHRPLVRVLEDGADLCGAISSEKTPSQASVSGERIARAGKGKRRSFQARNARRRWR